MSIRIAVAVVVPAIALGACGGGPGSRAARTPAPVASGSPARSVADQALARSTLAGQVTAIRRSFRGPWSVLRSGGRAFPVCRAGASDRIGLTGLAVSPAFFYRRRLVIRFSDYVYANSALAGRALASLGGPATEGCRERSFIAQAQRDYRLGRARMSTSRAAGALASEITVPATYRGRALRLDLDAVAVRQGRLVVFFTTTAGTSMLSYDLRLVRDLARIAQREQARQAAGSLPA